MIKNDKQLRVLKDRLQKFEENIGIITGDETINPYLKEAQLVAFYDDARKASKEIWEYENLKAGNINVLHIPEFRLAYEALIKARIAKGWTQAQLAEKIGVQEQQIQRYEANDYATASLPRLDEVIYALGIDIELRVTNLTKPKFLEPNDIRADNLLAEDSTLKRKGTLIAH
jgi:transcriptional regulator with XRE-family HTH domain